MAQLEEGNAYRRIYAKVSKGNDDKEISAYASKSQNKRFHEACDINSIIFRMKIFKPSITYFNKIKIVCEQKFIEGGRRGRGCGQLSGGRSLNSFVCLYFCNRKVHPWCRLRPSIILRARTIPMEKLRRN